MRTLLTLCWLFVVLAGHAAAAKVPAKKELTTLARDSLLAFDSGVKAKDFTAFHQQISELWREQVTPAQLKSAFQTFIDQELDLSAVATTAPAFDSPATIDDDGVLTVEGNYPIAGSKLQFRLKYVSEKSAWKLLGIKVELKPAGSGEVKAPTIKEARALARESLLAFNQAVRAKNFAGFHKVIAPTWQKQITPEKLQSLFQSFIDGEVDISQIAKLEPSFERGPLIDDDDLLQLEGSYPTRPARLEFKLAYVNEGAEWRLIKINLKFAQPDFGLNQEQ